MDSALIQENSNTQFDNITDYREENGIPVMPEHLEEYDAQKLSPDDVEVIDQIAQEAFQIWKENGYQHVEVTPESGQNAPACYGLSAQQAVIFDADEPEPEDYTSDHEFAREQARVAIHIAAAKKMCAECPLQKMCLTSSITRPSYGRDHEPKANEIRMEMFGIWGGWGPGAREMIIDRFVQIWGEADMEQ